jgi:hypothetical protein
MQGAQLEESVGVTLWQLIVAQIRVVNRCTKEVQVWTQFEDGAKKLFVGFI